jgi:probable F420-dependent oxidoreductase
MRVGVAIGLTDRSMSPDAFAVAVEERGFASMFVPEHTHMPVAHDPLPTGMPADMYLRSLDPFVALTAAAMASRELELGTSVCLVAQRDPLVLAKQASSLDVLSGGRLTLGVGYGWNRAELANHGVPWSARRAVVREKVTALRALWTEEVARFDGEHVSFAPTWSWPKPVQRPHPPLLLGAGLGPRALEDLVAVFDGWMPLGLERVRAGLAPLRLAWRDADRAGEPLIHTCVAALDPPTLRKLEELAVDHVSVLVPPAPRETLVPLLDRYARLLEDHHRSSRSKHHAMREDQ